MRVIAGRLKGRRLFGPRWAGLRPTSDRLRETLFEILTARLEGARVLDVYAGTGALGIEALSRGAAHVTFVERDRRAASLIARNLAACGVSDGYTMIPTAVEAAAAGLEGQPFDLIFLDPPYDAGSVEQAVTRVSRWLSVDGVLVLEHASRTEPPARAGALVAVRRVVAGDSALAFYAQATSVTQAHREAPAVGRPARQEDRQVGMPTPGAEQVAIYPGSFDPLTNGHVDIIRRGARLFDRIVVAILRNIEKAPLFSVEERSEIVREVFADLPQVEVDTFDGLLVHYARRRRASVIVRGLRAISDFEYEMQMALMNRRLYADLETVFMMPAETYTYVSSRLVKEVFALGGDVSGLVPALVEARLREKHVMR